MHQVDQQAVRFIGAEDQANPAGPHRWRGLVGQHMGDPNPGGGGVHRRPGAVNGQPRTECRLGEALAVGIEA